MGAIHKTDPERGLTRLLFMPLVFFLKKSPHLMIFILQIILLP